jgi:hypothetical protein
VDTANRPVVLSKKLMPITRDMRCGVTRKAIYDKYQMWTFNIACAFHAKIFSYYTKNARNWLSSFVYNTFKLFFIFPREEIERAKDDKKVKMEKTSSEENQNFSSHDVNKSTATTTIQGCCWKGVRKIPRLRNKTGSKLNREHIDLSSNPGNYWKFK